MSTRIKNIWPSWFVILIHLKPCHCNPARDGSLRSSTEDSLDSKEMASMSPPPAHSASPKGDDEVVSQRIFPDQGEIPEIVKVAMQDDSSAAGHMGEKIPHGDWQWGPSSLRPSAGYHSGDLYGSGVQRPDFPKRRRRVCSTDDLCPFLPLFPFLYLIVATRCWSPGARDPEDDSTWSSASRSS